MTPDDGPVDLRVDVFVDGRADLLFNFGAPYTRVVLDGDTAEHSASNLDAQRTVPIRIVQRGHVRIVGVRFRLGGVGAFVRAPLAPFTNLTPSPDAVFGEGARALELGLGTAPDLTDAARQLDAFFLDRMVRDDGRVVFERALGRLVATDGRAPVTELATEAGVSARHLDRLFARHLGIPPKAIGRILRFQGALRSLMRDPGCPLADVALTAGYFDQAHFIRDFRVMTGGVPRGYRGYYPPDAPRDFAPNVVVFVQDGPRRR